MVIRNVISAVVLLLVGCAIGYFFSPRFNPHSTTTELVMFIHHTCEERQKALSATDTSRWTDEQRKALESICELPER